MTQLHLLTESPLLTHPTLDCVMAWRKGQAVSVRTFLRDVYLLANLLPPGGHMLNICRDRYHFAVGLAAAIVSNKISLLPPTHTPEMVQQLLAFAPDAFCLYDQPDCTDLLPRLRYPQTEPLCDDTNTKSASANPTQLSSPEPFTIPVIDADQCVAMVFTSGSTGTPLPHAKSWGSLVRNVQAQAARLQLNGQDAYTIIGTVPPQHMYGFESTVLLALQSGNALSCEQPFYPADICSTVASVPMPRMVVSTPLHLRLLLDAGLQLPLATLVLSATAPLSTQLAHKVETAFDAPLLEIYGSTETGQIATRRTTQTAEWQLLPEIRLEERSERVWASHGHIEIPVALNDIVELIPEPLSEGQRFLLHGRMQDLINIAGKRTSLANLDYHLNSIPGVTDGAFYMPDEDPHDHVTRLVACVAAPGLTASRLLAELRTRIDAVFLPRPLLLVASLPRNSTGKLPRDILRQFIAMHIAAAGKKAAEGVHGNLDVDLKSGLIEETTPPSLHPKNATESKSTA
ncbi:MAG: AMP-binding protein [Pseudomonadota bacterium]